MQITPNNLYALYTRPLHMTPECNLALWPLHIAFVQLNLICGIESIKQLFTVLLKAQLL